MGKPRFTDKQIGEALSRTNGNVTLAAKKIGCSRETIRIRINSSKTLGAAVKEARESTIDEAESMLRLAMLRGEPWAIALILKTIGKDRGYTEKMDIDHGGQINVIFEDQDVGL